jgi:3-hexulose-6-phosphate synthase/6-phospho-3-hexuloisomerase
MIEDGRASMKRSNLPIPQLQIALDTTDLEVAIDIAKKVVSGGADLIEVGTPLIKSCGISSVEAIRSIVGEKRRVVADMKTVDVGYMEVKMAADRGADISTVLASASEATIRGAVQAGSDLDVGIMVDLMGGKDPVAAGRRMEELGVDFICVHTGIDELGDSPPSFRSLRGVTAAVDLPVAVAGGINYHNVTKAFDEGASIAVVGRAVTASNDPRIETSKLVKKIRKL